MWYLWMWPIPAKDLLVTGGNMERKWIFIYIVLCKFILLHKVNQLQVCWKVRNIKASEGIYYIPRYFLLRFASKSNCCGWQGSHGMIHVVSKVDWMMCACVVELNFNGWNIIFIMASYNSYRIPNLKKYRDLIGQQVNPISPVHWSK